MIKTFIEMLFWFTLAFPQPGSQHTFYFQLDNPTTELHAEVRNATLLGDKINQSGDHGTFTITVTQPCPYVRVYTQTVGDSSVYDQKTWEPTCFKRLFPLVVL